MKLTDLNSLSPDTGFALFILALVSMCCMVPAMYLLAEGRKDTKFIEAVKLGADPAKLRCAMETKAAIMNSQFCLTAVQGASK